MNAKRTEKTRTTVRRPSANIMLLCGPEKVALRFFASKCIEGKIL